MTKIIIGPFELNLNYQLFINVNARFFLDNILYDLLNRILVAAT